MPKECGIVHVQFTEGVFTSNHTVVRIQFRLGNSSRRMSTA
jgi:hypothetical protein